MYGIPPETCESPERYSQTLVGRMKRAYQLVQEKAKRKQNHQKEVYDKTIKGHPYQVDDIVFLHSSVVPRGCSRKFVRPWQGPFRVIKVISPSVFRIVDCSNPRRKQVVHFNRLKPAPASVLTCYQIKPYLRNLLLWSQTRRMMMLRTWYSLIQRMRPHFWICQQRHRQTHTGKQNRHQMKYHHQGNLPLWKRGLFLHHGIHDPQHGMGSE